MREINVGALIRLKHHRDKLTRQQYKTLRGQVLAGDPDGAMRGLRKLLQNKAVKNKNNVSRKTQEEKETRI